jgi:hypothetical protein
LGVLAAVTALGAAFALDAKARDEARETTNVSRTVATVVKDVEAVAAGRGWRCSTGGPVVTGGDLSGYACAGDSGKGTMAPLSMYGYIRGALDWDFAEGSDGEITGARVWIVGSNAPGGLNVEIIIDDENAGVCWETNDGERCRALSDDARAAVLETGAEIAEEIRAKFNRLRK